MLRLAAPSRPDWVREALSSMDTILLDHAHCEKKAASTAVGMLFRYPELPELMRPLSERLAEYRTSPHSMEFRKRSDGSAFNSRKCLTTFLSCTRNLLRCSALKTR